MVSSARIVGVLCAAVVAVLISFPLLQDALRVSASSDAELVARFEGAAFEDVFGFGFWVFWGVLAVVEFLALVLCWLLARNHPLRYSAVLPLIVFLGATIMGYRAYVHEYSLWVEHVR